MLVFNGILFGTENHLAKDSSGYRWVDEIPSAAFVFGGNHKYSIAEWLDMGGTKAPSLIDEKYKKMASELCDCLQNDSSYTSCIMTLQESNPKYEELSQEQLMEEVNKNCPEKSKTINNTFVEAN